jgi:hydroxyacylglutathione hydrolase
MKIVPFVHEGLGNSSYLVAAGEHEALLVDPDRTVARYLRAAEASGWRITAVLETHLHADFVSGAREAAEAAGARLFLPREGRSRLAHHGLAPGDRVRLGDIELEAVASAGHTPEHLSYVARGGAGPPRLFTGGSLIVGGAARTDLIAPERTDELTRAQYRTLTQAFASLPDETAVYPTHGGGSFCSTGGGSERTTTLGRERAANPVLSFEDEDEFARWFPTTFPGTPAYYARMRAVNRAGPRLRAEIAAPPALAPAAFAEALASGALAVDARQKEPHAAGHVPGALSIPFRDAFAVWLGWLAPEDAPLLFVLDGEPVERVLDEALLVGYERFAGVLEGGMAAWAKAGARVERSALVGAAGARKALLDGALALDVREPDEYAAGHIDGALHVPLGELAERIERLPEGRPVVTYCGHGERAATAVSLLERAGLGPPLNLDGGFGAWEEAGYPVATD